MLAGEVEANMSMDQLDQAAPAGEVEEETELLGPLEVQQILVEAEEGDLIQVQVVVVRAQSSYAIQPTTTSMLVQG